MNGVQIFDYNGRDVRTVEQDGEVWWVLPDVCRILGLSNSKSTAQRLDEDERGKFNLPRQGATWCVNEAGLYSVILRSDKPEARVFKRWVTHEVLPQIRRTGGYGLKIEEIITRTVTATVAAVMAELRPLFMERGQPAVPCIAFPQQMLKLEQFPPDMRARVDAAMEVMRAQKTVNFSEIARFCTANGYGISSVSVKRYYDKYFE